MNTYIIQKTNNTAVEIEKNINRSNKKKLKWLRINIMKKLQIKIKNPIGKQYYKHFKVTLLTYNLYI